MANSKANIHPIQLQNAELNLNKYDAEIKQYSGFNKNNAPFVGGCLANVFTKDTQIEGTSEDTYIDTNGDVYHVDTEGLWKNEEKIVEYPEGTVFYQHEKINVNERNVVCIYDEKHYIFKTDDAHYYCYCDGVDNYLLLDPLSVGTARNHFVSEMIFNIEFKGGYYFFLAKEIKSINSANNIYMYFRVFDSETNELVNVHTMTSGYPYQYYINFVNYKSYLQKAPPVVLFYNRYAVIIPNEYIGYDTTGRYSVCVRLERGSSSVNYGRIEDWWINFNNQDGDNWGGTYNLSNYVVLSDGTFLLTNCASISFSSSSGGSLYIGGRITDAVVGNNNYFYLSREGTLQYSPGQTSLTLISDKYSNYSQLKMGRDYVGGVLNYIFPGESNNLLFFNGYSKNQNWGQIACVQWNTEGKSFENRAGAVCEAGNFRILIYNNEVVGIGGKTNSDITGVLLTDWNNVDEKSILLKDSETIIYRRLDNNQWYLLKSGIPQLRVINDQLISNANVIKNSYDLKHNNWLNYANDWVCFYEWESDAVYSYKIDRNNPPESFLLASAINEYSLQNNSSIMLNPVNNTFDCYNSVSGIFHIKSIRHEKQNTLLTSVNIYSGKNDVVYNGSLNGFWLSDDKLEGLLFPITTDGNVQYSPSLFSEIKDSFGNKTFIRSGNTMYPLIIGNNSEPIMAFYLASGIDNLDEGFIVQGQFYGIINNGIYSLQYSNGVVSDISFIVDCSGLQFCGSTPYEALFFSPTNRCLYSFVGANVLNPKQFVDKISQVTMYKYNPATQSIFLVTDIGVIVTSLFGIYQIDMLGVTQIYLLDNGVVLTDDNGNYRYLKYYKEDGDGYTKENIRLETCFYGMNNQTVTINDCLYMRLFSEEMESGDVEVSATTISNLGRVTEKTTFKIKKEDWDKETNSIYLRYQPKEQRGLGVSFKIESPFKIASLSVGSQPDAILVDKVSKGAVNAPYNNNSSITEW